MMDVVFTRLVLGYLLALPFIAPYVARSLDTELGHTFVLRMASTSGGPLQLFYDVGSGYTEQQSTSTRLVPSGHVVEYRLPLPTDTTYHSLRIDPGIGAGMYTIERAAIVGADGATAIAVPLMQLQVLQQLTVLERTPDRLVLSAPNDSNDPVLVWVPLSPFTLALESSLGSRLFGYIGLFWFAGTVVVWGTARLLHGARPVGNRTAGWIAAFAQSSPVTAIVVTALLATVLATYPVLFAGRSFASPGNGGLMMLYDHAPFLPGATDFVIEDTRGADVGPMMWQSLPHSRVEREALAIGEIPLWNRYNALGRPLWGQGLSYILDPLHWLTLVGSDPALGWDLKFVAHRFVFAAGVGLVSLAATGAWLPAAVAAATAPFVGAFTFRVNHPAVFSLAYAPWTLLGWILLAKATSTSAGARAVILLAAGSSLLLVAPTPKEGAIALLGISATGVLVVLLSVGSWPLRSQRLAAAAVGGLAAVLLTTPHWLVFLDTLRASAHAYEAPRVGLAGIVNALALFTSPITPLPGLHLYALPLAIAAVMAPFRLWQQRAAFASAVGAALLVAVAFGIVPASWVIEIPLLANIGHLGDALLMAAMTPLLVVCAGGARLLWTAGLSQALVVTVTTGVVACWIWWTLLSKVAPVNAFEPWAVALLAPLAVAWPLCLFNARRRSAVAAGAVGLTMMALVLPGGLHLESGIPAIDRILFQPRLRPRLVESSPAIDAIHAATTSPTRATGVAFTLFPGAHVLYGLEDLRGTDPLEVPSHRELIDATGMQRSFFWLTAFSPTDVPRLSPILDMLNVGFLIARADDIPPGNHVLPMNGSDLVRAAQRPTPWPRAFFTDGISTYTTPADLIQQVTARRTPFAAILHRDVGAAHATSGLLRDAQRVQPADHYVLTANATAFRVGVDREGIAVLGETYMPDDFVATVNGIEVPYFRVNHVFKAVRIPGPGEWNVRFEYRPQHWRLSLRATALGALSLIMISVVALRKRTTTGSD